ncbi:MAG: hypothetical protein JWN49_397 [Parcubacteria group bacterium]|nr:hypothetical protein [Parcubacteria group bacterium]
MDMPTPAPAPSKVAFMHYVLAAIVVLVAAALVAGAYWFTKSSYVAFYGVRYLAGSFESRTLYQVGFGAQHKVTLPVTGRIIDYARDGGTEAAITVSDTGTEDVYSIKNGKATALTQDGAVKSGLSVSADGSMVAYAVRNAVATSTNPNDFYVAHNWTVNMVTVSDMKTQAIGIGYGPQFYVRDGKTYLLITSDANIHLVDVVGNSHQDIPVSFGVNPGFRAATISSDGSYVILPDIGTGYALYALKYSGSLATLAAIGGMPTGTSVAVFDGKEILSISYRIGNALFRFSNTSNPSTILQARTEPGDIVFKVIP